MPIKTFRSLLADSDTDTIRLSTQNGMTAYRIVKFELLPKTPGIIAQETICKIYKAEPGAVDGVIDFSDSILMAAAYYQDSTSAGDNQATTIIFDNEVFNQDIYITNKDVSGNTEPINYYLELEQMKLNANSQSVVTLKDIRTNLAT